MSRPVNSQGIKPRMATTREEALKRDFGVYMPGGKCPGKNPHVTLIRVTDGKCDNCEKSRLQAYARASRADPEAPHRVSLDRVDKYHEEKRLAASLDWFSDM